MTAVVLQSGFSDPVRESQTTFRAVMMALARPGTVGDLTTGLTPPAPLTAELAAVALTLADHETTLWLDPDLAAAPDVDEFLRFHTGARRVGDPSAASFALSVAPRTLPPLSAFAQGTDEYPDRSTTLVVSVAEIAAAGGFILQGPGVNGRASLALSPEPAELVSQLRANKARFPRGVDCIFVAPGKVAALPRSTLVTAA